MYTQPGAVVHTFNPSTLEAENLCEMEAMQTYTASSRPAKATGRSFIKRKELTHKCHKSNLAGKY